MKNVIMRKTDTSITVSLLFWIGLLFAFVTYFLYLAYLDDYITFCVGMIVFGALFIIPSIIIVAIELYQFFTIIEIDSSGIKIHAPLRKQRFISKDEIAAVGRIAFLGMSTKIYICITSKKEILDFYSCHKAICLRLFGLERVERLSKSKDGCWKMAVAAYAAKNKNNMFYIYHYSKEKASIIADLLELDSTDTGPGLIKTTDGSMS